MLLGSYSEEGHPEELAYILRLMPVVVGETAKVERLIISQQEAGFTLGLSLQGVLIGLKDKHEAITSVGSSIIAVPVLAGQVS